jgi:hypothetical protein
LAAGRPLSIDKLLQLFVNRGPEVDRSLIRRSLDALSADYAGRGLQLKEVANGYRIQIKASMTDWLQPLWEERPPRYTRALLETLALVIYRQPVTRGDIEEVRGVAVSPNIIRTLLELPEVSPQTDLIDSLEIALSEQMDDALPESSAAEAYELAPEDERPEQKTKQVPEPADQSVETSHSSEGGGRQAHPRGTGRDTLGSN